MKKLMLVLLCGLLLSGCVFTTTLPDEQLIQKPTTPLTESAPPDKIYIAQPIQITIYHGNDNADGFETLEVTVDVLDASVITQKLVEAGVLAEGTTLLSHNLVGTCLHLDFNEAFLTHLNTMGTSGERMMIGSVVNTFLTAYPEAESVSITANGEIMESGHVIYDFELTFFE